MKIIDSSFTSPRSSNFTPYQDLNDTGLFLPFITRAWNSVVCLKTNTKKAILPLVENRNHLIIIIIPYQSISAIVIVMRGSGSCWVSLVAPPRDQTPVIWIEQCGTLRAQLRAYAARVFVSLLRAAHFSPSVLCCRHGVSSCTWWLLQ